MFPKKSAAASADVKKIEKNEIVLECPESARFSIKFVYHPTDLVPFPLSKLWTGPQALSRGFEACVRSSA